MINIYFNKIKLLQNISFLFDYIIISIDKSKPDTRLNKKIKINF